jgi:ATP-binding cassette subfamily D (ALD) protein 3
LWQIDKGVIVKPGASTSGLHADIFYVPQKPYNVLGTLSDQITYPEVGGKPLSTVQLRHLLQQVELVYLLDRDDVGSETEVRRLQCHFSDTSLQRRMS